MAKLVYDGNSPYGVGVRLANRRSLVNVSAEVPFELGNNLTEKEIKYYKSLVGCGIKLVGAEEVSPLEVVEEVEVAEEPVTEVIEEEVVVEEPTVEEVEEEVKVVPTPDDVYYKLVDTITDEQLSDLCSKVGFKSKKRSTANKLWDLLSSDKFEEVLDLL